MTYPLVKDLTVTAEALLYNLDPMAVDDSPRGEFLPEKISVKYWPTPEGWCVWSIYISGRAILKNGEIGKRERAAYYTGSKHAYRPIGGAPDWARAFVTEHTPEGAR